MIHHGRFCLGCVVMRPGNRAKLLDKERFGVWYGAGVKPGLISIEQEEIAPTFRAFLDLVLDQAPGDPPIDRIFPQMMMLGKLPRRNHQTRPPPGNIIAWFPALGAGPIWAGQDDGGRGSALLPARIGRGPRLAGAGERQSPGKAPLSPLRRGPDPRNPKQQERRCPGNEFGGYSKRFFGGGAGDAPPRPHKTAQRGPEGRRAAHPQRGDPLLTRGGNPVLPQRRGSPLKRRRA